MRQRKLLRNSRQPARLRFRRGCVCRIVQARMMEVGMRIAAESLSQPAASEFLRFSSRSSGRS